MSLPSRRGHLSLFEGPRQFKVPLSQYKNYISYALMCHIYSVSAETMYYESLFILVRKYWNTTVCKYGVVFHLYNNSISNAYIHNIHLVGENVKSGHM